MDLSEHRAAITQFRASLRRHLGGHSSSAINFPVFSVCSGKSQPSLLSMLIGLEKEGDRIHSRSGKALQAVLLQSTISPPPNTPAHGPAHITF